MTERVVCLCCGSRYPAHLDCPNYRRQEHSFALAAAVARYLLVAGHDHPDPVVVREAVAVLRR